MNKISVIGRIGRDPEQRFLPDGTAILSFALADDIGFGDKKATNWWNCTIFGKRAETLQQYLAKGTQVVVWGGVTMREYNDKDGNKRVSPDVRIDELALVGSKPEGQQQPQQRQQQAPQRQQQRPASSSGGGASYIDNIPFAPTHVRKAWFM